MRHHGPTPEDPASPLFLDRGVCHVDSEAVLHAGWTFGGWGRLTSVLRIFPKPVRDRLYRQLARNRYALFGRADMCALPDPAFQARLLR